MPVQTETNKEEVLNEFSKSEEQEEEQEDEEEQYVYYACRECGGRHPQGEHPHKEGDSLDE